MPRPRAMSTSEVRSPSSSSGVTITTIAGHCCYSCRAFFRRTVARVARAGLKRCRTGGRDCDVASVPGRGCSHCRYTRCLAIGMEPALLQGRRAQQERDTEVTGDADKGEHGGSDDVSKDGDGDTLPVKTEQTVTTDVDIVNLLPPDSPDTSISKAKTEPQFKEEEDDTKPVSVMAMVGPYMSLTVEEQKLLDKLVADTQVLHIIYTDISTISTQISTAQVVVRSCCPAWLHQARVRAYLGTLTPGEMGGLVTASRQAQNYFHHNTMFALPYFNDLTAK